MAIVKTRPHYNVVFAVLLLGIAAYGLLQSLVVPVFSLLIPALHTTQSTATWLMTGYLLSASVATPILGRIGDKVGKERMLVVTLVALAVGSLLAAITTSVSVMIVARVIQGLGGGVIPLAFGIIRDEFPVKKLNGAVGIASSLIAVGSGAGLVLAGPIVQHLNYHWLFWIPMIITAIAAVAAVVFVPESPVRSPGKINWGAALLLSAWLVALLLAVSQGPKWGWTSGWTLGLFAAAVVCAIAWVVVEMRSSSPLIDMRTMRFPAVWTTNIVAVLTGAAMYAMMTFLPQLIQTPKAVAGYGLSASITQSGLYMLPLSIAMFLIGFAIGPASARIGSKAIVMIGAIITTAGFVILALGHDKSWEIYATAVLLGLGIGMSFSSMPAIIVQAVPPAQTGAATGMNANVRTVGGAIGSAVSSVILTSGTHVAHGLPADSGYTGVFWFLGGVSALAVLASVIIPSGRAKREQPSEVVIEAFAAPDSIPVEEFALAGAPATNGRNGSGPAHSVSAQTRPADPSGRPIQGRVGREGGGIVTGVVLTLIDPRGQQVSRTSAAADGEFAIDAPKQGSYVLIASAPGHQPAALSVLVGARPRRVEITLPSSGELIGTVRRAGSGVPIAEATVTLTNTRGEVVGAAVSDENGAYTCGVTPGVHTVVAVAANMRPGASTLTVPESGMLSYDIELEPTGVLAGAVQAGDRLVPDAQVSVLDAAGDVVAVARTDANGRYLVPDLPEGRYAVVARGYPPVTSSVTVEGNRITHDVDLSYS